MVKTIKNSKKMNNVITETEISSVQWGKGNAIIFYSLNGR